jgi:hypothetical protein
VFKVRATDVMAEVIVASDARAETYQSPFAVVLFSATLKNDAGLLTVLK